MSCYVYIYVVIRSTLVRLISIKIKIFKLNVDIIQNTILTCGFWFNRIGNDDWIKIAFIINSLIIMIIIIIILLLIMIIVIVITLIPNNNNCINIITILWVGKWYTYNLHSFSCRKKIDNTYAYNLGKYYSLWTASILCIVLQ